MTNPFSLHGRRALVTGANTGIGQTIAVNSAAAGAGVVCAGRSANNETVNRITKAGAPLHRAMLILPIRWHVRHYLQAKALTS